MTGPQRDAFELVRAAIRAVDGVFARLSQRIGAIVRGFTRPERRAILRQIDVLLDAAFGLTQRAALVSELFVTIVRATDPAVERPALRLLERIGTIVRRRDPLLWRRIEPRLRADLGLRVWSLDTTDLTDPASWQRAAQALRQASAPTRLARSRTLDPNRAWVNGSRYRLSDRVWRQGRIVRRNIDAEIRAAIRRGDSAVELADRLEAYLNPERAPVRFYADGRMVSQFTTSKPTGAGHGSVYARTLARTEIMRIHGAATIEAAKVTPGVLGIRWRLSGSHPEIDACDDNASRSSRGLPRGVYRVDEVPRYPNHPNDLCVLVPEMLPAGDVVDLIVKQYGGV